MPSRVTERVHFGKIKEVLAPPNLIELQTNSYREFLQTYDTPPSENWKNTGLQAVFTEVFPIPTAMTAISACLGFSHSYRNWRAQARLA